MANRLNVQNIYASDSDTTAAVQVSGANVTLNGTANDLGIVTAGTIGGGVTMASSGLTVRNIVQVALASDESLSNDNSDTIFFSPTYTPLFSGSKVQGILTIYGLVYRQSGAEGRKVLTLNFTGSGITDLTTNSNYNLGVYDYGSSGAQLLFQFLTGGQLMTTTSTATITCNCKLKNYDTSANSGWIVYGNNTIQETHFTWIEYK